MKEDVYTKAVWAILEEMEYDQFRPELVEILKQFFPEQSETQPRSDDGHWEDDVHLL